MKVSPNLLSAKALILFCIFLASCGQAGEGAGALSVSKDGTAGWETICLDRFLISVPKGAQVGAPEPSQGAPGFNGIRDIGGKGQKWGGVDIVETAVSGVQGFELVYAGAAKTVASPDRYRHSIKEKTRLIQEAIKDISKAMPKDIAAVQRLEDKKKDLADSRYGLRVSGKAVLMDVNAFAFRSGDDYSVGYLDVADKRIRNFSGTVTNVTLESPEAAALEFHRIRRLYHRRAPTDIPTTPGYCTAFGFIDEGERPEVDTRMDIPFRSLNYPNLIFILTVEPAWKSRRLDIQKLPNMDKERADLHLIGIKGYYGPVRETILGTLGRSVGYEFGPNCSETSCRPADQAYEFEAETFGRYGRPDQPNLTLHMVAATSDDYRLNLPVQPDEPSYNKPSRPGLSGTAPPPYKEGKLIFEQVLRSIRLRPGAFATTLTPGGAASPSRR